MGFVKNAVKKVGGAVGSALGINGKSAGYESGNLGEYENAFKSGLFNRMGAGTNPDGSRNFSNVGGPIQGSYGPSGGSRGFSIMGGRNVMRGGQNNYNVGNQSYDMSAINNAIKGFGNAPKLNQTYTSGYQPQKFNESYSSAYQPKQYQQSQFNFQGLPQQYYDLAYGAGSKDVRREGAGNIEQLQQAVGPRRLGTLAKSVESAQRATGERLADLSSNLGLERMRQGVDLNREEQMARADESRFGQQFGEDQERQKAMEALRGYDSRMNLAKFGDDQSRFKSGEDLKGYQSRADLEKNNASLARDYLQSLGDMGLKRTSMESELLGNERDYQDKALDYLNSMLGTAGGLNADAAGQRTSRRGQTLNLFGDILGSKKKIPGLG